MKEDGAQVINQANRLPIVEGIQTFAHCINAMEASIDALESGVGDGRCLDIARQSLAYAISTKCGFAPPDIRLGFAPILDAAATSGNGRREAAILVLRALAVDGLLPFAEDHSLERRATALIEGAFSDQLRGLRLNEKRQTYEKLVALKGYHGSSCQLLKPLSEAGPTLADIESAKADIQKATRNGALSAYLEPFSWAILKGKVNQICDQVSQVVGCNDASYKQRFEQLSTACFELKCFSEESPTFLTNYFVKPFVNSVEQALLDLKANSAGRFACSLEPRRKQPIIAEKKYPLHLVDKLLTITVPFVNHGPGMAVDVTVELDCGTQNAIALESEDLILGDIPPGDFAISFRVMVVEPSLAVPMVMQVNWSELFGEKRSVALDVRLSGQDATIDWAALEQLDPYSLEVAEGDRFVGRTAKVQAIGNRLVKTQMSSTYITGQKRVGKTSLAQAVLRYLAKYGKTELSYEPLYLEWGEYCAADATGTVRALGEQLYAFLRNYLSSDVAVVEPTFEGSLAPLNAIAKSLEARAPTKRFIVVLDEFDEIHPEMYRLGALAEAFFANLRTLAARRNLAFILVGGEKMPFIIGAQGDQLNKFVPELLDYFSRGDEWVDYVELVTSPVRKDLNWEDGAISELFNLTNGHPYFTKLLAAKVFSNAVTERDTEIIASDVRHAASGKISELDTNAFAHFWKDGLNCEREKGEVIELKRLRTLVAPLGARGEKVP